MISFWVYRYPLPLRPVWPGFVLNSLLYAASLWLLISGPFTLRRMIRRKRGLCPKCAYDLRGTDHAACPECGTAIEIRAAAHALPDGRG